MVWCNMVWYNMVQCKQWYGASSSVVQCNAMVWCNGSVEQWQRNGTAWCETGRHWAESRIKQPGEVPELSTLDTTSKPQKQSSTNTPHLHGLIQQPTARTLYFFSLSTASLGSQQPNLAPNWANCGSSSFGGVPQLTPNWVIVMVDTQRQVIGMLVLASCFSYR